MAKPKEEWRHLELLISLLFLFIVTPVVAALRHDIMIKGAKNAGQIARSNRILLDGWSHAQCRIRGLQR